MIRTTVLAVSLATTLVAGTALAQNLNFLRDSPIGWLDEQDRAILTETIDAVLEAPDGTTTDWLNPETGSHGRLQVLDTHEAFDTTCRRMRMRNEAKGRKSGGDVRLCLSKDGRWRFAPTDQDPAPPEVQYRSGTKVTE